MPAGPPRREPVTTPSPAAGSADDDSLKVDNQLCVPLYVASRLVTQAYGPHLEALGLTYPQYVVLLVLWETDGASVSEIGERLSLDSGTLTPLLKRMVAAELVLQKRVPGDGRVVRNYLTPRGRGLKAEAVHLPGDLMCEVDLSAEELDELRGMLQKLIGKLQRRLGADAE